MIKYGIYQIKEHDYVGRETPHLSWGWFDTCEDAQNYLERWYHNGEKQRYDNDFYGHHYAYWYEIYASDTEHPLYFYDMDDYVRDLVNGEEHIWDTLTNEQKDLICWACPLHTKFWLAALMKGRTK